jgi:hypothetical protein
LQVVVEAPDLTLAEIRDRLSETRHVGVDFHTAG